MKAVVYQWPHKVSWRTRGSSDVLVRITRTNITRHWTRVALKPDQSG